MRPWREGDGAKKLKKIKGGGEVPNLKTCDCYNYEMH